MEGLEELTIELCGRCPQQCLHCSSDSSPLCGEELSESTALGLVRQAAALGTRKISLGGGEPTLSRHFEAVVAEAAGLGMGVEVFTCGITTLPPELKGLSDCLLASWAGMGNLKVIFSLQGATGPVHDRIAQVENGHKILLESLRACTRYGIPCEINFVPLKPNVGQFGQLVDFAEEVGVGRISILRFVPQGRGLRNRNELELSRQEEDLFVGELLRLRKCNGVEIRTGSPFNGIVPGNKIPCRAGFRKLVVQGDGNVLPCEVFKDHRRRTWHLNANRQSLKEILASQNLGELRGRLEAKACLACPIHRALRGQQRAEGENERVPESAVYAS